MVEPWEVIFYSLASELASSFSLAAVQASSSTAHISLFPTV